MNQIEKIEQILIERLNKLAIYAGFNPSLGLHNGRMGAVIVLYSASRYFKNEWYAEVAELILEDLLKEAETCSDFGFTEGLMGVAWGIDYLMKNEFLEQDDDFFVAIDDVLCDVEGAISKVNYREFAWLGLYIFNRSHSVSKRFFYEDKLSDYINLFVNSELIPGDLLKERDFALIPFLYCLHQLGDNERFPKNTQIEILNEFSIKFENSFQQNWGCSEELLDFLLRLKRDNNVVQGDNIRFPFSHLNAHFSDVLLFGDYIKAPNNSVVEASLELIMNDELLHRDLEQLLTPFNLGLFQPYVGFIWTLLSCCINFKIEKNESISIL